MPGSIRVAISGGGLAGASLLHALLQELHLDVHIFESAENFTQAGAAVAMTRNALAALNAIGPATSQCLKNAGAVAMQGARYMLAQGEGSGNVLVDLEDDPAKGELQTSIVHRAAFLKALLADVPPARMHTSKKLVKVDHRADESLELHFADGTAHECDILIGADGIHSYVRRLILGDSDPAASPRNTGFWCVMALKPYAEAQARLGDSVVNINDPREYDWVGDGAYLLHNILEQGQLVQLIIAAYEKEAEVSDQWRRTVSADEIKSLYKDWPPHLNKAVIELLCDQPEQPAMYLWEHPPARTYVSGSMAIMGDAAHATSPWQASGGGMSIEDSLILSKLFSRAKTPAEARTALRVYDEVRRPRTQRIVESSRGTGMIVTGKDSEAKLDFGKLRAKLSPRWDFIIDFDINQHVSEAMGIMEEQLKAIS
ncbi:salicylate hydroxylase [Hypoxylon argillaceum]|nr:salicylate hydroxylase [Hypoxylon argillaceum]